MALGLSALLVAALTLPAQTEFSVGGRFENRSGVSPRVPGQPSLSAIDFIIVPILILIATTIRILILLKEAPYEIGNRGVLWINGEGSGQDIHAESVFSRPHDERLNGVLVLRVGE